MSLVVCFMLGCGATQGQPTTAGGVAGDPEQAAREVSALLTEHCEEGVHGDLAHVADDVMVVGTAGEIMEGRTILEETNASYAGRGIQVRHDCDGAQRWVNASADGNVVWAEEAIRTNAEFPDLQVSFPSQRAMIFERTAEGWRLRYYSLSVRLPDEHLDEVYGVGHGSTGETPPAEGAPAAPDEAAPAEDITE